MSDERRSGNVGCLRDGRYRQLHTDKAQVPVVQLSVGYLFGIMKCRTDVSGFEDTP